MLSPREGMLLHTAAADKTRGKFFRLKLRFAHTRRLQMCWWRDAIAGSSSPISPVRNLFGQNQHEIASTGKQNLYGWKT